MCWRPESDSCQVSLTTCVIIASASSLRVCVDRTQPTSCVATANDYRIGQKDTSFTIRQAEGLSVGRLETLQVKIEDWQRMRDTFPTAPHTNSRFCLDAHPDFWLLNLPSNRNR
ncbi:hypothetical protein PTI98_005867 [Pleurotus ostreatus]|nr:hypothetical protein PTI98_005867 [Pleurotus ostreatus]